jgi:hypothetical protein
MIKLIRIEKRGPDSYVVVIDKHGTELRFDYEVERDTSSSISIFPHLSEMEDAFLEYALKTPPGRPGGVLVIPIVHDVIKIIRDIDKGIEHEFPIVLHPE